MKELRSKYQRKNYHSVAMTEIDCPYCRGTYLVDLAYAPIHHGQGDTQDLAELHCPYCAGEIWQCI